MPGVAPGRYAGREPKRASASSSIGVAVRKSVNSAWCSCTRSRYTPSDALAELAHRRAERFASPRRVTCSRQRVNSCSSAPASVTSSVRSATGSSPNCCEMISPCSVILMRPFTVPGGSAASARYTGEPPPRPTLPPRPWKRRSSTPASREQRRQRLLPAIERPRRREDAGVLPGVGVADHHFLPVAARRELAAIDGIVEQRAHHAAARARDRRASRTAARRRCATAADRRRDRRGRPRARAAARAADRPRSCVIETMYVLAAASLISSWIVRMARKVSSTRVVAVGERDVRADERATPRAARGAARRRRTRGDRAASRCRRAPRV